MSELTGWSSKKKSTKKGCPWEGCGREREVQVTVHSRGRAGDSPSPGYGGKHLASTTVSLCNEHALELYGALETRIEEVR